MLLAYICFLSHLQTLKTYKLYLPKWKMNEQVYYDQTNINKKNYYIISQKIHLLLIQLNQLLG